jgi:predicted amidophosphoribosyltransferase
MPQFLCPTCGARLYSASPLTKCAWCGTPLSSKENEDAEHRPKEKPDDEDESG